MKKASMRLLCIVAALAVFAAPARAIDPRVQADEARRVAVIEKVKPSVVAIFAQGGMGGGSGVVISEDGYALTNFHVVGQMTVMQCGLPDGVLYDAVLVGIDKVGDVALIKLLPKKPGQKFPPAVLGDSDTVKAGDWALAMGNPFLLATDFTPTVTYGLVSGVHRYQFPAGLLLEYTDCIQVDTSINPGNSGGPLFDMKGELVGINGRISIEKRGRVNSGVGYAISINQIKNFLGHLKAGLDTDHASLGALVRSEEEDGGGGRMTVVSMLEESDAFRRGLGIGDELVRFAGRPMASTNNFKNVLGVYPRGWRVPLVFRHENEKKEVEKKEILVRLMGVQRRELEDPDKKPAQPAPQPPAPPQAKDSPAAKLYEAKAGFANYHFNKLERDRLLAAWRKQGDFLGQSGPWLVEGAAEVKNREQTFKYALGETKTADGPTALINLDVGIVPYKLEPLKRGQKLDDLMQPANSGGLIIALYHYWQLLTLGQKGFEGDFSHGGHEPFYPPPPPGTPVDYTKQRIDCEVLLTEHAGVKGKWYFALKDQTLLGFEISVDRDSDPCEVYLSDYKPVDGKQLPHRLEVRFGNDRYGAITVRKYQFTAGK